MTLGEIAKQARRNLDENLWDYLRGGADSESSVIRNRMSLAALAFKPRVLHDVSNVRTGRTLFGAPLRIPVILPPIGSAQQFDAGGGAAIARAAADFGTAMMLSSACLPEFEEVAVAAGGTKIYQLYLLGDQAWMDDIIARSIAVGYGAFCLTVDTPLYSRRERDIHKRYVPASGRMATGKAQFDAQARMTWETVAHIKETFDIPLILKGIIRADDAARAVEAGVDGIYVSNHGGRQLDHARGCATALPEVVAAVAGRAPVIVDGGFLRGADVVKGLCLGADAVGTGRLVALGLAAGGAAGVVRALELLEEEIKLTLGMMGVADVDALSPDFLESAPVLPGAHDVLSAFPLLQEGY